MLFTLFFISIYSSSVRTDILSYLSKSQLKQAVAMTLHPYHADLMINKSVPV